MVKGITNADKYLKNGANIEELAKEIDSYIDDTQDFKYYMTNFFNAPAKHILSDDERVILRNIDTFVVERIGRNKEGHLYLWIGEENKHIFVGFDKLFQFIKERRRIRDSRIAERRINMSRKEEFEEVKKIIKENYDDAECGIFNTRNIIGDPMTGIFRGEYFEVDICYSYAYYEVFGTTDDEWQELEQYYSVLGDDK